jgi:hypothetical protein
VADCALGAALPVGVGGCGALADALAVGVASLGKGPAASRSSPIELTATPELDLHHTSDQVLAPRVRQRRA